MELSDLEDILERYGLSVLLLQNDIEELTVLELLIEHGLFDPEDYIFVEDEANDY